MKLEFDINHFTEILSEALDATEKELLGAQIHHGRRVAILCRRMGEKAGMSKQETDDLTLCALMHDSALSECREEYTDENILAEGKGQKHCNIGENNLKRIIGKHSMEQSILYHHERADGKGPFSKGASEIPIGAQFIHIADELDLKYNLGEFSGDIKEINKFAEDNTGSDFTQLASELFGQSLRETKNELSDCAATKRLPFGCQRLIIIDDEHMKEGLDPVIKEIGSVFSLIVDYKSPFTAKHSSGVANNALKMAEFSGYSYAQKNMFYLAGALHDIGKLFVNTNILEKPGRLTEREYEHIQSHAYETWRLLSKVSGFETLTKWASLHHEYLNGTGYPFGLSKDVLSEQERTMTCIDIYTALTENRPYKAGMSHQKAIGILKEMAEKGMLDAEIVSKLSICLKPGGKSTDGSIKKSALFQCGVCGYIYEGDEMPYDYVCPVCGEKASGFVRII